MRDTKCDLTHNIKTLHNSNEDNYLLHIEKETGAFNEFYSLLQRALFLVIIKNT